MSLYPKPAMMQDLPIEKENPALKAASTPQPQRIQTSSAGMTKTYGRLSQTPKTSSSRAPMTPGCAQRRNIFQHQLLMKQYEEEKVKKERARALSALATPARVPTTRPASVSVRRPVDRDSKLSALTKTLGSLTLDGKPAADLSEDEGFHTPDDEFYDVPDDFDFKHDTPAKAYRRSVREHQAEEEEEKVEEVIGRVKKAESSRDLEQELRRAQTRLDVGDVAGAQRICNHLYETQQQKVFKSAKYYAVAATVSRRSKNVVKAISLLSSAVRAGAEPAEVLRTTIQRFLEAPEGKAVRLDLETLLHRLSTATTSSSSSSSSTSTAKTPSKSVKPTASSASKIAAFRSRTQASLGTPSKPKPQDEQEVKVLTALMASAIEKEKVLQRRLAQKPAAPLQTTTAHLPPSPPSSATAFDAAPVRKQAPRTCEIVRTQAQRAKQTQRLASSPFFRSNRPPRAAEESRFASRALDFTPTVIAIAPEQPEKEKESSFVPSAEPVAEAADDNEFVVRYEAPDLDEDEDQGDEEATEATEVVKVGSAEVKETACEITATTTTMTKADAQQKMSATSAGKTDLLQDWLGKSESVEEEELGRFRTFALTQPRGRQPRRKAATTAASADQDTVSRSLLVPVEIGGEVALMSYDQSGAKPSDQILTPVRRSARLNPQAAAHQLKPKVLKFRENPL